MSGSELTYRPPAGAAACGEAEGAAGTAEASASDFRLGRTQRTRPVFVVGCGRSGTTLLYHMILSSGGFAVFPLESNTFGLLSAKFPGLNSLKNRRKLLEFWLQTKRFTQSGLQRSDIEASILSGCRNAGDFLRIVMEAICRKQGVERWGEKTPDNTLYISEIKRTLPDALVVHIIRDGRDAALSLVNYGLRPFLWERGNRLLAFGVYWKWIVQRARTAGRKIGPDYYELHFEDLVERPRETLARLGEFIGHNLDYDHIRQVGVGSVTSPDTSFQLSSSPEGFNPVGRWKRRMSPSDLAQFEALAGDALETLGYALATPSDQRRHTFASASRSFFYTAQLELRQWLKSRTPLRRLVGRRREM